MHRFPDAHAPDPYPECQTCGVWVRTGMVCRNCGAVLSLDYFPLDNPPHSAAIQGRRPAWPPAWLLWPRMSRLSDGRR